MEEATWKSLFEELKIYGSSSEPIMKINNDIMEQHLKFFNDVTDVDVLNGIGKYYKHNEESDKALKYFFKASDIDDQNINTNYNIGHTFDNISSRQMVIIWLTKSANLGHADSMYILGNKYFYDNQKFTKWLEKACELNHLPSIKKLGHYYYNTKNYTSAIKYFKKYLDQKNDEVVTESLGFCYKNMKNYELALEMFTLCKNNDEIKKIKKILDTKKNYEFISPRLDVDLEQICSVCFELLKTDAVTTLTCMHHFHYKCLRTSKNCPLCRKDFKLDEDDDDDSNDSNDDDDEESSIEE